MPIDLHLLSEKEQKLQQVSTALKEHFIGVDNVIDEFIGLVKPWYLASSLLDRPIIINLWGMTGVGKTDLVRRFVKLIDFQDRFLEIELSNSQRSAYFEYENSLSSILHRNKLFDSNPSVLFFDEIQHFRTIDQDGTEITDRRFQDFWELLSDGQLSRRDIAGELEEMMVEMMYEEARSKPSADNNNDSKGLLQSPWMVKKLKKILDASADELSFESLISMPNDKILELIKSSKKAKKIYETIDLKQALIIVGGNLDSLYTMSGLSSEAEIDANIFHDQTKKLNIIEVKNALQERFRPEQISRLGNSHIIYPSLSSKDFRNLIRRRLKTIEIQVEKETAIQIHFDEFIETLIYRNGVFPTQGVRPVYSAISEILVSRLTDWILLCVKHNQNHIHVSYLHDSNAFAISFPPSSDAILQPFNASLDKVRGSKSKDEQALVATHEAGHAVTYAILFKLAPLQLKSRLASSDKNGFTFPHKIEPSKENIELQIQVLVAGFLAEELIFGHNNISSGHRADIERATSLASSAIRELNFGDSNGKVVSLNDSHASEYKTDIEASNEMIEKLLDKAIQECRKLILENEKFLRNVAKTLSEAGFLEPEKFIRIAACHGIKCDEQPESWVIIADYNQALEKKRISSYG